MAVADSEAFPGHGHRSLAKYAYLKMNGCGSQRLDFKEVLCGETTKDWPGDFNLALKHMNGSMFSSATITSCLAVIQRYSW